MAFNNDYGNNPRNYFVTVLIQKAKDVDEMLYVNRSSVIHVFPAMKGIIQFLNAESQKELSELSQKIDEWRSNKKRYDRESIENAFGELMAYLHTGYLKEVNWVKPRFEAQKLEFVREKPEEHKQQKKSEKSKKEESEE